MQRRGCLALEADLKEGQRGSSALRLQVQPPRNNDSSQTWHLYCQGKPQLPGASCPPAREQHLTAVITRGSQMCRAEGGGRGGERGRGSAHGGAGL